MSVRNANKDEVSATIPAIIADQVFFLLIKISLINICLAIESKLDQKTTVHTPYLT